MELADELAGNDLQDCFDEEPHDAGFRGVSGAAKLAHASIKLAPPSSKSEKRTVKLTEKCVHSRVWHASMKEGRNKGLPDVEVNAYAATKAKDAVQQLRASMV